MPNTLPVSADAAQSILDSLAANIAILNMNGDIVRVNRAWASFGADNGKRKCCRGENYLETCQRSKTKEGLLVYEGIKDVMSGKISEFSCEYPCDSPGQRRWFRVSCTALESDRGREIIVAHHDISDLKFANERVSLEQSKLQAVFRAIADAVIICDSHGKILSANRATERLLRTMQSALTSQNISEIVCTDLAKLGDRLEAEVKRGDGTTFHAEVAVSVCEFRNSALLVLIVRDVTERIELQQVMASVYSTVCHELRSPMASIIGGLSLIRDGLVDPAGNEAAEMVDGAISSADRLVNLIGAYLDRESIIRMDANMELCYNDASAMLSRVRPELSGLAGEANVQIKIECGEKVSVHCDPERIHQVLVNLCSNAIKFSPVGGKVVLSFSRSSTGVRFSVRDRGRGIPQALQSKIFEPFAAKRLGLPRSLRGPSSVGLGLSISHAIVEAHGGRLGVISEEGEGTTFWFDIPMLEPSSQSSAASNTQESVFRHKRNGGIGC